MLYFGCWRSRYNFRNPNGIKINENNIGKKSKDYDSIFVVSLFKGHQIGGFGGALKQLSIDLGFSRGKTYQHTAGVSDDQTKFFQNICPDKVFKETIADAANSIVNFIK